MPELRCDVHSCVHNKNMYCDLDKIEVGGREAKTSRDTSCNSFVERKGNTYILSYFFHLYFSKSLLFCIF